MIIGGTSSQRSQVPYVFDLMFGSWFEGVGQPTEKRGEVRQTFILHFRLPSINRWDEDMKTLHFVPRQEGKES